MSTTIKQAITEFLLSCKIEGKSNQILKQGRQIGTTYRATTKIAANSPISINTTNNTISPSPISTQQQSQQTIKSDMDLYY